MANFDYAQMVFAAVFCLLFFGKAPDLWTLVGAALIAAGGLIVLTVGAG
jgi:drug/metabolite transporter (DMT)-like permease